MIQRDTNVKSGFIIRFIKTVNKQLLLNVFRGNKFHKKLCHHDITKSYKAFLLNVEFKSYLSNFF